jgi:hypothetical protein
MEDHLRHKSFTELRSIVLHISQKLRELEPFRIKLLPEVFKFLVELKSPGETLLSNALVTVDDFASKDRNFVHEYERCHELAAHVGKAEIAVRVADAVGETEEKGEEAVSMVE